MRFATSAQSFVLAMLATLLVGASTNAATVNFTGQNGLNVVFDNITETNGSTDPNFSLFAGINSVNDTLDFDAFNFRQDSLMIPPSLDGRLSFSVAAKPGRRINSITVQEVGSYTTVNEGIANYFLGGVLQPEQGPNVEVGTMESFNGVNGTINSDLWSATITFDGFMASEEISIDLDNRLTASGLGADYAFIDKKLVLITVGTVVPEPASLAFLVGCVGLVATRRRRRA